MKMLDALYIGVLTMIALLPIGLSVFDKWDEWEETTAGKIVPSIIGLLILMAFAVKCK